MLMRTILNRAFVVVTIACYSIVPAVSQAEEIKSDEKKSDEVRTYTRDELEVIHLAGLFSKEFQRTKDLKTVLIKYGAPNYGLWISRSKEAFEKEILSRGLSRKISPNLFRDLHTSLMNWFCLHMIWLAHQDDDDDGVYPLAVRRLFEADPYLKQLLDDNSTSEGIRITSRAKLFGVIRRLELSADVYRGLLRRFPQLKSKTYLSNVADWTDEGKVLYEPNDDICEDDEMCFGLKTGQRYYTVEVEPHYVLIVTRTAGKMKVIYVMPCLD